MYNFAFLLKTYEKDFSYARRLLESFEKHNKDNIHCYVVLPRKFQEIFVDSLSEKGKENLSFIAEEEFEMLVEDSVNGLSAGYINQEIIKLAFWEKGFCKNYCCLDSDAVFIRDFYLDDFMFDETTPYSVLIEDKDLKTDPVYYKSFWIEREKSLKNILQELQYEGKKLLTCHGFQILSRDVLENFKENFMNVKEYSYSDLLKISPYEFTWYNIWLQKSKVINIYPCEPMFKTFHMKHQLIYAWLEEIRLADLARSYVGIVINSNFINGVMIEFDDPRERKKGCRKGLMHLWKCYLLSRAKGR